MRILYLLPYVPLPEVPGRPSQRNFSRRLLQELSNSNDLDVGIITKNEDLKLVSTLKACIAGIGEIFSFGCDAGLVRALRMGWWVLCGFPPGPADFASPGAKVWLDEIVSRGHYDLVIFDFFLLAGLRKKTTLRCSSVLIGHDAYSMRTEREFRATKSVTGRAMLWLKVRAQRRFERSHYRYFDQLIVLSVTDREHLSKLLPEVKIYAIPSPLDDSCFVVRPLAPVEHQPMLLIGVPVAVPAILRDALVFVKEYLSHVKTEFPEMRVVVWGAGAKKIKQELGHAIRCDIEFVNHVDDYKGFLSQRWIYLYPRRVGSGFHVKLAEAMALGLPIVGFSELLDPLGGVSGEHYVTADSPRELVDAVNRLSRDREIYDEISARAADFAQKKFHIDFVGKELRSILDLNKRT